MKKTVRSLYVIKILRSIHNFSSSPGGEAARNSHIKMELNFKKYMLPRFNSFWSNIL